MNVSSLHKLTQKLRELPRRVAQDVAKQVAPVITEFANESFANSEDPYGAPWAPKADGTKATLEQTGRLRSHIRYVAIGTKLRVELGVPYAKFQIGKRPVYPRQGGVLPEKYRNAIAQVVRDECKESVLAS